MRGEKLDEFKQLRQAYETRIKNLLLAGMADGSFNKVDADVALFTLLSSVRWVEFWYKPSRNLAPAAIADDIIAMVIGGLKNGR